MRLLFRPKDRGLWLRDPALAVHRMQVVLEDYTDGAWRVALIVLLQPKGLWPWVCRVFKFMKPPGERH